MEKLWGNNETPSKETDKRVERGRVPWGDASRGGKTDQGDVPVAVMITTNLREARRALLAAKQRSLLALLGIVIGIGSVIALVSVGSLAQREALRQFTEMGTDIISIQLSHQQREARRSKGQEGIPFAATQEVMDHVDGIRLVSPSTMVFGELRYQGKRTNISAVGVQASYLEMNRLKLKSGRFISDLDSLMSHVVIGGGAYEKLKSSGIILNVGDELFYQNRKYLVVGILERAAMGAMRPYESIEGIMIPLSTALKLASSSEVQSVMMRLAPGYGVKEVKEPLERFFAAQRSSRQIQVQSPEAIIEQLEKQSRTYTLLLGVIGSISLIVGGVGVMNVMLVSVSERKREIGIRRALGAQKKDIQWQFLIESVLLSLAGGILGVLAGVGSSWIIARQSEWEFVLVYGAILLGFGVSFVVGIFFGFYPAKQAAALNPIEALRSE
jgi:putative ABC transport system permease protein